MPATVTIPKKEYERLKKLEIKQKKEDDIIALLEQGLQDARAGKTIRVR